MTRTWSGATRLRVYVGNRNLDNIFAQGTDDDVTSGACVGHSAHGPDGAR